MLKGFKKVIGVLLIGIISLIPIGGVSLQNSKMIYAAESKALQNAKAKINHLTNSLKTNYLGLKNQATGEKYIKEAKNLINKVPSNERSKVYV